MPEARPYNIHIKFEDGKWIDLSKCPFSRLVITTRTHDETVCDIEFEVFDFPINPLNSSFQLFIQKRNTTECFDLGCFRVVEVEPLIRNSQRFLLRLRAVQQTF